MREVMDGGTPPELGCAGPAPEKPVEDADLAEAAIRHFSEDELDLLWRRLDGKTWPEIAAQLNASPDALRRRLERGIERVKKAPALKALMIN